MQQIKRSKGRLLFSSISFLFVIILAIFTSGNVVNGTIDTIDDEKIRTDEAVSCAGSSLTHGHNALNMQGGATEFSETIVNKNNRPNALPEGMVWIPGGEFSMGGINPAGGSEIGKESVNDAKPVHRVQVRAFFMDASEVTNKEFAMFVRATGYTTVAETTPTTNEFPTAPEENLIAGSMVFGPQLVDNLNDHYQWWNYVHGADWKHPQGPCSNIIAKDNYPVVHIAWEDAAAYAKWAGKRLPTEAEWEFAARGGIAGGLYAWGNQFKPAGNWMANTYQGKFPQYDIGSDGYAGIAPIKQFPANGYGLYDIAGNVWEWCSDWYRSDYYETFIGKIANNPQGPATSHDPAEPDQKKKVQRGGSFLCTDQYCTRYMMGTRGKGEIRSSTNHLGFRCVKDIL